MNMKTIIKVMLIAMMSLMLVNCSKNEEPETIVNDNLVSIKATNNLATPMTKTSIGTDDAESTRLINWSTGDQIGVICSESGATNEALTLSSSADSNTGTFTGNLTWSETPDELHNFYAYYPYSSSDVTDGVLSGSVPSSQTQVGNDNSDNIGQYIYTVASKTGVKQSDGDVQLDFTPINSVVEVDVTFPVSAVFNQIQSITLSATSTGDHNIAGNFTKVVNAADGAMTYLTGDNVYSSISLDITDGTNDYLTLTQDGTTTMKFYIAILPTEVSEMTVGLNLALNGSYIGTVNYASSFTSNKDLVAGKIYKINFTSTNWTTLVANIANSTQLAALDDDTELSTTSYNYVEGIVTTINVAGDGSTRLAMSDNTGVAGSGIILDANQGIADVEVGDMIKVNLSGTEISGNILSPISGNISDDNITVLSSGNVVAAAPTITVDQIPSYAGMAVQIDDILYAGTANSLSGTSLFKAFGSVAVNDFETYYYSALPDKSYIEARTVLAAAATIYGVAVMRSSTPTLYIQSRYDLVNFLGTVISTGTGNDYNSNINTILEGNSDTNCYEVNVKSVESSADYSGLKLGTATADGGSWTSSAIGALGLASNRLKFDACGWNDQPTTTLTITINGGGKFTDTNSAEKIITLDPYSTATGAGSTFIIDYTAAYQFSLSVSDLTATSTITFSTSTRRAIITAINLDTESSIAV